MCINHDIYDVAHRTRCSACRESFSAVCRRRKTIEECAKPKPTSNGAVRNRHNPIRNPEEEVSSYLCGRLIRGVWIPEERPKERQKNALGL